MDGKSTKRVTELMARAGALLPDIAAGAAERERTRELPHQQIRDVAAAGLLALRVPERFGGAGASVRQLFAFLVDLAAADSNVAQAVRPAYAFVENLIAAGSPADHDRWFPRVLAGDVFGNAGWEIGGPNGAVRTRITKDGDRFRVNGSKFYSTGALFADWVSSAAVTDDDTVVGFTVPSDREGLRLVDDWDGIGQRLTASGTTELADLLVHPDEIRPRGAPGRRSPVTAVLQLFLAAVLAGIARNALRDAVDFTRDKARPIAHSAASRSVDDPFVQHTVGEIAARANAAVAVVLAAAESIDSAGHDHELLVRASVDVAQAQFVAAEQALRAAELVFDVGGGSATLGRHNLDRHWRNARTVANHNPRAYKAAAVGAFHLTGAEPPTSGLF